MVRACRFTRSNNNQGVAGVCWDCSIAFIKWDDDFWAQELAGIQYAMGSGAQILNGSFGWGGTGLNNKCNSFTIFQSICDNLEIYSERDGLGVFAAGNGDGSFNGFPNRIEFPANSPDTIAVGASDQNGLRANFSNYGNELDIVAPGVDILSTFSYGREWIPPHPVFTCTSSVGASGNNRYGDCNGTSMSTPMITGTLGLMRSVDPLLDSNSVKDALFNSGHLSSSPTQEMANGIPDVEAALKAVLGEVNGTTLVNRLTPLFSFYSSTGENSYYTSVPQAGFVSIFGGVQPRPRKWAVWGVDICGNTNPCWAEAFIPHQPAYGSDVPGYPAFPHEDLGIGIPPPKAEVYVFTSKHNPETASEPLVPLYRMARAIANGSNTDNVNHAYASDQAGINHFVSLGFTFEGIEGYVYDDTYSKPTGTEKLIIKYNSARDDHAIFPESKAAAMAAAGYTGSGGISDVLGYVYLNTDSDSDGLVDGFERIIGTCITDAHTDNDTIPDGLEVMGYPRTDPISSVVACGGGGC